MKQKLLYIFSLMLVLIISIGCIGGVAQDNTKEFVQVDVNTDTTQIVLGEDFICPVEVGAVDLHRVGLFANFPTSTNFDKLHITYGVIFLLDSYNKDNPTQFTLYANRNGYGYDFQVHLRFYI